MKIPKFFLFIAPPVKDCELMSISAKAKNSPALKILLHSFLPAVSPQVGNNRNYCQDGKNEDKYNFHFFEPPFFEKLSLKNFRSSVFALQIARAKVFLLSLRYSFKSKSFFGFCEEECLLNAFYDKNKNLISF